MCYALVLCVAVFMLTACSSSSATSNTAATVWDRAATELDAKTADLQVAVQAGNTQHAVQIREDIIQRCRTYFGTKDAASDAEIRVRTLCSDVGAPFP